MRKVILIMAAAGLILGGVTAHGVTKYESGVIIIKFKEVLNFEETPNGTRTQHPNINRLNERYSVYKIEELYDFLPQKPINDPHGKWEWRHWLQIMEKQRYDTYYMIKYSAKENPKNVAKEYAKEITVDFAEPNYLGELCGTFPNDPDIDPFYLRDLQWNLYNFGQYGYDDVDIDAEEAWDYWPLPPEMPDPWVAVIDTGSAIDEFGWLTNWGLTWNVLWDMGKDLVNGDDIPEDLSGHGTHLCGIISADTNNEIGVAGTTWNKAKIIPIRIATSPGEDLDTAKMAIAMLWAALQGADVENLSFGVYVDESNLLKKAAEGVYDLGVTMVAARGNDGGTDLFFPASYPQCIAVTALTGQNNLADFSNYGWDTECTAPGEHVWSTWSVLDETPWVRDRDYNNGTSVAAAHVSAVCAIIVAASPMAYDPPSGLIEMWVRPILHDSCDDIGEAGPDQYFGHGRLNLKTACDMAFSDGGYLVRNGKDNEPNANTETGHSEETLTTPVKTTPLSCVPNPAATFLNISGMLGDTNENGPVKVRVFDLSGRNINTLSTQARGGLYSLAWDLTGSDGIRVPPGVYVISLTAGKESAARKIVVGH